MKEEENDDLPMLEDAVPITESKSLAKAFNHIKDLGDLIKKFPDDNSSHNSCKA